MFKQKHQEPLHAWLSFSFLFHKDGMAERGHPLWTWSQIEKTHGRISNPVDMRCEQRITVCGCKCWDNFFMIYLRVQFSSVQFSRSIMSDSLRTCELQHPRPPCPPPTPGVYSNSCPSSWWYHPAISSSVVPFSFCPQSLPASGSFPMSQLFAWEGQSIGVSALASVLPMNTQDWSPLEWTGWIFEGKKIYIYIMALYSCIPR